MVIGDRVSRRQCNGDAPIDWQPHHFIAGRLCLDLANTVVDRNDASRRQDRLSRTADVEGWRRAAGVRTRPYAGKGASHAIAVRECVDRVFRAVAGGAGADPADWRKLVRLYARHAGELGPLAASCPSALAGKGGSPGFLATVLHSAVELAFSADRERLKACQGCGWLFIDRTRNRSKRWCIPTLCGNREKARRHYRRTRGKLHEGRGD